MSRLPYFRADRSIWKICLQKMPVYIILVKKEVPL